MWPWGHLAVGYVFYSLSQRVQRQSVRDGPALLLAFGTQLPDLIDKPLAWTFGVLPSGRTFAHSLFAFVAVYGALVVLTDRRRSRRAFGIGWLSHLFADALYPLLAGDLRALAFLAWPVLDSPTYETPQSFAAHLTGIDPDPLFLVQFAFLAITVAMWYLDGTPGLRPRWWSRVLR